MEGLITVGSIAIVALAFYVLRDLGTFKGALRKFFRRDPMKLSVIGSAFSPVDLPNLDVAIRDFAAKAGSQIKTLGYSSAGFSMRGGLTALLGSGVMRTKLGPVLYREVPVDLGKTSQCVENGVHLIDTGRARIAAHIHSDIMKGNLQLEVMADPPEAGVEFHESVRAAIAELNVYRGKVLSLEADQVEMGRCAAPAIRFRALPKVERQDIILPEETLRILERNTIGFFEHAGLLARSGRSVKRGLLLHGKPGTGKTFTAKWLAQAREGLTVILLSGEQLWLIKECCQLARMLAPSLVIMEDVDLIATQRDESRHPMYQVTLHQLLNELDGLASDAPVLFLLTTNRLDAIEPAIASRPGRVDQAIEYPLPDAGCRRRLIELYAKGLDLQAQDIDGLVARTEGASPAFIQEMIRKAALISAEEDPNAEPIAVTDAHLHAAIRELIFGGGELTRNLLGFAAERP